MPCNHLIQIDDKEEEEEASIGVKTRLTVEEEPHFRNETMALQMLLVSGIRQFISKFIDFDFLKCVHVCSY